MSCSVEFDRSSLYDRLGRSFMATTFRDIREVALYEIEKSFFAATQDVIEVQLEVERLRRERSELDNKYDKVKIDRTKDLMTFRYSTEIDTIVSAIDKYLSLSRSIEVVDEQLQDDRKDLTDKIEKLQSGDKKKSNRTYVLQCPKEDCKGMLSNESKTKEGHFFCSICETITCVACKMIIKKQEQATHTCDPDILKSVELLEQSSKPCPTCGIPIHRISGCSQMFCTQCHASWDWRSGRLNNGQIHNPHHSEWLRTQRNRPRELGDIPCGRELNIDLAVDCSHWLENAIRQNAANITKKQKQELMRMVQYIFESMRVAIHHNHITIPTLGRDTYGHETNQELRVNLLLKRLSEDDFRREIQRRDKANSKRNELLQIVLTYRDAITDLVWPYIVEGHLKTIDEWKQLHAEMNALEEYVNGCFELVSCVYGSTIHQIMNDRAVR